MSAAPTTILQTQTVANSDAGWTVPLGFNDFNSALGTALDVQVGVTGDITGSVSVENLGATAAQVSIQFPGSIAVNGSNNTQLVSVQPDAGQTLELGAYDGTTDFAGGSGTVVSGISNVQTALSVFTPGTAGPVPFVGTGTLDLTVTSQARSSVAGNGNLLSLTQAQAGATVSVQYDYTPASAGSGGGGSDGAGLRA